MNRPIVFDSPFLLGFEHTRSLIERAAKAAAESYPPYNVEERPGGGLRIIRSFVLADGMEVEGALLEHGLLHIDLDRPEPDKLIKRIPIQTAG